MAKIGDTAQEQPTIAASPTGKVEDRKFDDKGHFPETDVANKDLPHVAAGQIEDKGTPVGQMRRETVPFQQGASVEILRAARPTVARDPNPDATRLEFLKRSSGMAGQDEAPPEDLRPENRAMRQTQQLDAMKQAGPKDDQRSPHDHPRDLPGIQARGIPGSRVGNPLEMGLESKIGSKVHDIQADGSFICKVQSPDHLTAFDPNNPNAEGDTFKKMKLSVRFPPINPMIAQRHFKIWVGKYEPAEMVFPPDVPNVEVLVFINQPIHMELTHIDQNGLETAPYIADFYSNHGVGPRQLGALPLGVTLGELVNVVGQRPSEEQPEQSVPLNETGHMEFIDRDQPSPQKAMPAKAAQPPAPSQQPASPQQPRPAQQPTSPQRPSVPGTQPPVPGSVPGTQPAPAPRPTQQPAPAPRPTQK